MQDQTIGTCSLCGGAVSLPVAWWGVTPPVATCSQCGAIAAAHGPVIPMVRPVRIPTPFIDRGLTVGDGPGEYEPWRFTAVPNTGDSFTTGTVTITLADVEEAQRAGLVSFTGGES